LACEREQEDCDEGEEIAAAHAFKYLSVPGRKRSSDGDDEPDYTRKVILARLVDDPHESVGAAKGV
jgi:hypothetical protein